jgi:hypothetical protein
MQEQGAERSELTHCNVMISAIAAMRPTLGPLFLIQSAIPSGGSLGSVGVFQIPAASFADGRSRLSLRRGDGSGMRPRASTNEGGPWGYRFPCPGSDIIPVSGWAARLGQAQTVSVPSEIVLGQK